MAIEVVKIREFTGHSQAIYALCHQGPGAIYSGGGDGMLVKWSMYEQDGMLIARHDSAIYSILACGDFIYSGTQKGTLTIIDERGEHALRQLNPGFGPVFGMLMFHGQLLAVTGSGNLLIIDPLSLRFRAIPLSEKSLRKIIEINGQVVVTGSDGMIRTLDTEFTMVSEFRAHELSVFALAYHPGSGVLFSGGRDATLRMFKDGEYVRTINAHLLHMNDIAINPAQTTFLTCSMDKHIKLWRVEDMHLLKVISHEKQGGHTSSVNKILWFDKNNFISCSDDRTLKCFEILEK